MSARGTHIQCDLWPRQIEALESKATEILFGGATRGGKSHFARVQLITGCLNISNLQCTLVRKKFQDILDNHVYGPQGFKDLLGPLEATGQVSVTQEQISFSNGSRIAFKHCQDERQFDSAQGITSHILVVDEATQISERLLRIFRGWCTMDEGMKAKLPPFFRERLPRILYTANPVGVSVPYFRRHFVKARPAGTIEQVGAFKRQYIPSRVEDNPSENAEATAGRMAEIGDKALARALLEGDWDAPVGEFFPEWNDERHVIADFTPPEHWFTYGTYDWGTSDPSCAYFWTVSDGESFEDENGRIRWYPRDAIIAYKEIYFCDESDPSKGARLRNEDMADKILRACELPNEKHMIFLTDSLPHQDRGGPTIAEVFRNRGVFLKHGDTNRPVGWSLLRSRLIGKYVDSNDPEPTPMIYATESCIYARDYIPALPRHKTKTNDAADDGEATHAADCWRYACASRPRTWDQPPKPIDPAKLTNEYTINWAMKKIKDGKAKHGIGF
jgi:hypothetical protein